MYCLQFLVVFLLSKFGINNGASCTTYETQADCNRNNLCVWYSYDDPYCACASTVTQEVLFVMDSSGSVGTSGWQTEVDFVKSMITSGVDDRSPVGVINFNSGAWTIWDFQDKQFPRGNITKAVDDIVFQGGATYMGSALDLSIDLFDDTGDANVPNLLMFITDGNPWPSLTQSVCGDSTYKDNLDAAEIKVVLIGVGGSWDESAISCLVDDPTTQIIEVDDFGDEQFDAVREFTDTFLCPATISLALTEVRVQDLTYNISRQATTSRFVEFYVDGVTLPLRTNPLILNGLLNGNITRIEENNNYTNLTGGSYLVFYDSLNGSAMPYCYRCDNCNDTNGDGFCDGQYFISCNGPNDECTFDTSYDNNNWWITVQDGSDDSYIVQIEDSSSWPDIVSGWTFELGDLNDNDESGSNWEMSCYQYGTPGDAPIFDCQGDCIDETCRSKGDTEAYCGSGAFATCICSTDDGYFLSGPTCDLLYPPDTCDTLIRKEDEFQAITVSWSAAAVSSTAVTLEYQIVYLDSSGEEAEETNPATQRVLYSYNDYDGDFLYDETTQEPRVRSKVSFTVDSSDFTVFSDWRNCSIATIAPSLAPTLAPTYAIPLVPSCTATVQRASADVDVVWTDADLAGTTDGPPEVYGYMLFYEAMSSGDIETVTTSASTLSVEIDIGNSLDITDPFSSDDLVASVAAIVYDSFGEIDTDRMQVFATNCTLQSPAPTPLPTSVPSGQPSSSPSDDPTHQPTSYPTYEAYVLSNCVGKITNSGGVRTFSFSWDENDPVSDHDRNINIRREIDGEGGDNGGETTVSDSLTKLDASISVGTTFSELNIDDAYYIWPEARDRDGGDFMPFEGIYCIATSDAPTLTPSNEPSTIPSDSPSNEPSITPSNEPTVSPTPAPTYTPLVLEDCIITLDGGSQTFVAMFTELEYDSDGELTPVISEIRYRFTWTASGDSLDTETVGAVQSLAAFETRIASPNGFDSEQTATVTVETSGVPLGDPSTCDVISQSPTVSPTTGEPTPAPTYPDPSIYIDVSSIGGEEDCNERDDGSYECTVAETQTPTRIDIIREPNVFPYDIAIDWEIVFMGPDNNRRRVLLQDEDTSTLDLYATEEDFEGPTSGTSVLEGQLAIDQNIGFIEYHLTQDDETEGLEQFILNITGCAIDSDDSIASIYQCSLGSPTEILMSGANTGSLTDKDKNTGDLPPWVWMAIGAGVLALALIGLLGYRFIKQKRLAEIMEEERKNQLRQQMTLDDASDFGESGDSISVNPMATGGSKEIKSAGAYIEEQIEQQKTQMDDDFVALDFEPNSFRQSFGPVQMERPDLFGQDAQSTEDFANGGNSIDPNDSSGADSGLDNHISNDNDGNDIGGGDEDDPEVVDQFGADVLNHLGKQ